MKLKNWSAQILAILSLLLLSGTVAPAGTINILQTFDYPFLPNATATLPQKISDQGDLVGTVMDADGQAVAFIYKFRIGRFSNPIKEPNDTGNVTQGRGINNLRRVCGEYLNATDGTFHGYKLFHPEFAEFDVANAVNTFLLGINNAGDLAGSVTLSDGSHLGFISVRQRVTMFQVPDAIATFAYQVNTADKIVGYYTDANGLNHGYTRDTDGTLTYPIDVAGATETLLLGNNDSNWTVGRYTDALGVTHGLYYLTSDTISTYDYPGATFTSINGINVQGTLVGHYVDTAGLAHGFIGKLSPGGTSSFPLPAAPAKANQGAPFKTKIGEPTL